MRLYHAEGHSDRLLPNLVESARLIIGIYSGYILSGTLLYVFFGMNFLDAFNHAAAALSTGGFSTHPESIGYYQSLAIEIITIVLMLLGSTNFFVHLLRINGKFKEFFLHCETSVPSGQKLHCQHCLFCHLPRCRQSAEELLRFLPPPCRLTKYSALTVQFLTGWNTRFTLYLLALFVPILTPMFFFRRIRRNIRELPGRSFSGGICPYHYRFSALVSCHDFLDDSSYAHRRRSRVNGRRVEDLPGICYAEGNLVEFGT